MTTEIKESDWKVLRRVHPIAVERFCERILGEIERLLHDSAQRLHERYLRIYKLMEQRDREMARLFNDPRRSRALTMIAQFRAEGLMTDEEFVNLTDGTRHIIETLVRGRQSP